MLAREGEEAIDEVEVAGEGGFVFINLGSMLVTTFGGFLNRCETLRFLVWWKFAGSVSAWVMGAIWSVLSLRITSSLACLRTGKFLKLKDPKSSLPPE
jgi:hypothetical protein